MRTRARKACVVRTVDELCSGDSIEGELTEQAEQLSRVAKLT